MRAKGMGSDSVEKKINSVSSGSGTVETTPAARSCRLSTQGFLPGIDPQESQNNGIQRSCCVILTNSFPHLKRY